MKRILGLGSGRVGTKSIVHILKNQKNSMAHHEPPPHLPYKINFKLLQKNLNYGLSDNDYVGYHSVVGFFYINYIEYIIQLYPDIKIFCLTRDHQDIIDSYYNKYTRTYSDGTFKYKNVWNSNDRSSCKSYWSFCFPDYKEGNIRECISKYVKEYYQRVNKLVEKFPNNIKFFHMNVMNDNQLLDRMFAYLGIKKEDRMYPEQNIVIKDRRREIRGKDLKFSINKGGSKCY